MATCRIATLVIFLFTVIGVVSSERVSPGSHSTFSTVDPSTTITTTTTTPLPASCRVGYMARRAFPTEQQYYQHQTCYWCYHFVPKHRKTTTLELVPVSLSLCTGREVDTKFKIGNETYFFDPDDSEAWGHVRESMIDGLEAEKLEDCCWEAVHCCRQTLQDPPDQLTYCPRTWDGWSCIPPTPPDTTHSLPCPHHAYRGYPECTLSGQKQCTSNGSWAVKTLNEIDVEHTDYSGCSHRDYHIANYHWEAATHAVSLIALLPAIVIIIYYRHLRVQRFFLHLSLFLSLLGEAFFATLDVWLLRLPEYIQTQSALDDNSVWCRMVVSCRKLCSLAVWCGMLAESIYLHRLIVAAFKGGGKTWVYIVIGWVPAVCIVTAWCVCRGLLENYQCWLGDDHATSADLYLITEVPKFVILIVNTILLANMTRVLLTKLRGVGGDQSVATRRAVKATAFLLPMFGLQFFVPLYVPPPSTPCQAMQVYFYFAMAVDGLQGLYVATVYCYINKEVQQQLRRSLHRARGPWGTLPSTAYDPRTDVSMLSASTVQHPPSAPEEIPLTTVHKN